MTLEIIKNLHDLNQCFLNIKACMHIVFCCILICEITSILFIFLSNITTCAYLYNMVTGFIMLVVWFWIYNCKQNWNLISCHRKLNYEKLPFHLREETGHGSFLLLKGQFLIVPAHIQNSLFLLIWKGSFSQFIIHYSYWYGQGCTSYSLLLQVL